MTSNPRPDVTENHRAPREGQCRCKSLGQRPWKLTDTSGGHAGHGENFRISFGFRPALVRHDLPAGGRTFPSVTPVPFGTGFALETAQNCEGLAVPAYSCFFTLSHLACGRWLRASVCSGLRSVARRNSFLSVVFLVLPAPFLSGCSFAEVVVAVVGLRGLLCMRLAFVTLPDRGWPCTDGQDKI